MRKTLLLAAIGIAAAVILNSPSAPRASDPADPAPRDSFVGARDAPRASAAEVAKLKKFPHADRMDADNARVVYDRGGMRALFAAGRNSVCLTVFIDNQLAHASCGNGRGRLRFEPNASIRALEDGRWQVQSIVPDGVKQIELETAAGRVTGLESRNSLLVADVEAVPLALSWVVPGGEVRRITFTPEG